MGQVRLRVLKHTDGASLSGHVHGFTEETAIVYTDEWRGYNPVEQIGRAHV